MRTLALLFFLSAALPVRAADNPDLAPLKKWLAGQNTVRTVQADFTQTRSFRALRDPIAVPGHLAYSAPNSFRWELGDPPKTILLRKADTFYLIMPNKKRVERRNAADVANPGSGGGAMPMMDFPLAKNYDDFNRRFEVLNIAAQGDRCHVEMLPKDPQMRKFLEVAKMDFNTESGHLISFEFVTRDGSSMRNDFTNVRLNAKIEPGRFDYDFTGYDVSDVKP